MKLHNFLSSGVLGYGVFSGIMRLLIGFSAITLTEVTEESIRPENFLQNRFKGEILPWDRRTA